MPNEFSQIATENPFIPMKIPRRIIWISVMTIFVITLSSSYTCANPPDITTDFRACIPTLNSDSEDINDAFRIAMGDLMGNVSLFKDGLLEQPVPVILAGLGYNTPWTRDASINAWNGASLIMPDVARNTLLSVLMRSDGAVMIGGQYWDCIVWVTGAWYHYLYTGDKPFLALALEATKNSLAYYEKTEFDADDNLFRGPAWSDGIAAYPNAYANTGGFPCILDWPKHNPDKVSRPGYGIPMKALSTNCLYYSAYLTADKMAIELGGQTDPLWKMKAARLKKAINTHLWNKAGNCYRMLIGPLGNCDHQEGLGSAYALLFGIADDQSAQAVFANQHITPAGIPCGWPNLARYESKDGMAFGRHMGTVWPQIQGFWAEAAARAGKAEIFAHELYKLAAHARRDRQFTEIYHPLTELPYGGLQEKGLMDDGQAKIILWPSVPRQTWAATAFLRMVLMGLAGMRFDTHGIRFQPCLPNGISRVELKNLAYRNMNINLAIHGSGTKIKQILIDGQEATNGFVAAQDKGHKVIVINLY